MSDTSYSDWFRLVTGNDPHDWQRRLGDDRECRDRTIRIPTGFGKTAGVVLAWLWHRVERGGDEWPRRLVFCLPMRVLVEQTDRAIAGWLASAGLATSVGLHVLMGGTRAQRWIEKPEQPAILVGTQDMLLSRALNRGYAASRPIWPMEFGLLHQDSLWVFDEVQLMDVGLATSAQLATFRERDRGKRLGRLRPVYDWWMSATLQSSWLKTIDRPLPSEPALSIPPAQRRGGLFDVEKALSREATVEGGAAIAARALAGHTAGSLTLVVVNRVATALQIYDALDEQLSTGKGKAKSRRPGSPELELVHSRFRGLERVLWADRFLRRDAPMPEAGRIVVATQVVEAGVDISAALLVTELAPWASLVQRFGRAARYGGSGEVVVVGPAATDEKSAAPYAPHELAAAHDGIGRLIARCADASPRSLEAFEEELREADPALLGRLYPYDPLHVLRRRDLDDLFDTSADLSGTDLDVSRFIRSGEARDAMVFWRAIEPNERALCLAEPPRREELCPVPIGDLRTWKGRAFVLDYLEGEWIERKADRLAPGMIVLLAASDGGYTVERGWAGKAGSVDPVPLAPEAPDALARASLCPDAEDLSVAAWKTIATHGRETEAQARALCKTLGITPALTRVVALAGRWHDVGKAHDQFQDAISIASRGRVAIGARRDLAKAPDGAWRRPAYPDRPGFRHELASTLALFELLWRRDPFHPALLGPHRELLEATGTRPEPPSSPIDHPLADEIAELSAHDFNLLAWLVCTHHGKVRCVWTSTPQDQEHCRGAIHGVRDGDRLPAFALPDAAGAVAEVPPLTLSLAGASMGVGPRFGASWSERVAGLRRDVGPFALAFLEALLRVADWRASQLTTEDPLA